MPAADVIPSCRSRCGQKKTDMELRSYLFLNVLDTTTAIAQCTATILGLHNESFFPAWTAPILGLRAGFD